MQRGSARTAAHAAAVACGAVLVAAGFNLFLIPHKLLSGGVFGISMIAGYWLGWNIGLTYLLLNVPLLIWGFLVIGSRFIVLSIQSVAATTWTMQFIPEWRVTEDPIIAAVFGGVLIGVGSGMTLRAGGSSGGIDIVGSIVTRSRDLPLGMFLFALNGLVVLWLGYPDRWDAALCSMLSIYITGRIVDAVHIRHVKVTAFIVSSRTADLLEKLLKRPRGVTLIKTTGAFTHAERDMLMTVTTRYELEDLKKIIQETDPKAFVNIVETVGVMGEFRRLK